MARKLTPDRIQAMIEDYEAWNPYDDKDPTTAEDIAARHGVSKQTLYQYVRTRKRATTQVHTELENAELRERLSEAQQAVLFLTGELMVARAAIEALEKQLEEK